MEGARAALTHECEKFEASREATLHGAVDLYWLHRWMSVQMDARWSSIELGDLRERCRVLAGLAARFEQLLPRSTLRLLEEGEASSGKIAIQLTEVQGNNSEAAAKAVAMELELRALREELERSDITLTNLDSASQLAQFEEQVLFGAPENAAATGVGAGAGAGAGARKARVGEFGLPALQALAETGARLSDQVHSCEEDVTRLRRLLAEAIDASESPHGGALAGKLFDRCREILGRQGNS